MQIEVGRTYFNGCGCKVTIGGVTRGYPHLLWSLQGDWYERDTGRRIIHHTSEGEPKTFDMPTWRDLVSLAE